MREGTLQRQLIWLIILRVVIVTTLMATLLVIQFSPGGESVPTFGYIYSLVGLTYLLSLIYLLLLRTAKRSRVFVFCQFLGDVAIETGLVHFTGGMESPFTFLYLLSIITAAIMLFRRGGFLVATASCLAYAGLIAVSNLGLIEPPGGGPPLDRPLSHIYFNVFLHFFAFYSVALLVSYLSENLRRAGSQLEEKSSHLADLQAFNELVLNSMSSGLITLDLQGRITKVNMVALRLTAYRESDLLGEDIFELLALDRRGLKLVRRKLKRRRFFRFDLQVTRRDGVVIPVGVSISSLLDKSGQLLGYIVNFQDLTELRKLEEELRIKDRLAAVGEMAAGMAHEIRNPLASISGSVQFLESEGQLSEDEKQLMAIIRRESGRLDRTIQDFLAFARPSSLVRQSLDLSQAIRDTVTLLRKSEELLDTHRVETGLPEDPVVIQADGDRIRQVIWNVCLNSLRAMVDGGTLLIRLQPPALGMVVLEFVDQGHGFTVEQRSRVFHPFSGGFRRGAGLGLAIVYKIIRAHGGRVDIANNPDRGATVRVELPQICRLGEGERSAASAAEDRRRDREFVGEPE